MNNFRNGIMRRMRVYTKASENTLRNRNSKVDELKELIGCSLYDRKVADIEKETDAAQRKLKEDVIRDLSEALTAMRKVAAQKTTTPPTAEMVNTLQILSMLNNITPTQMELYAKQMADCPLAMLRLGQIAATHNLRVSVIDPDALMTSVDILEGNLSAFLNGFNGDETKCGSSVRQLYNYFQPEEYYARTELKTAENADKLFWNTYIGYASQEVFDNPNAEAKAPIVQYFFGEMDGLLDFIEKARTESRNESAEEVVNKILANCPDEYGAAYRAYKATGEKLPLNVQN